MFNQNIPTDTKIAVLEERLSSYEIMIKKIDEAIQVIGQTSQNINKMLAVHNEKIEQCSRTDDLIVNMIDDLKRENKEDHNFVIERIETLEKVVEDLKKFRWQFGAIIAAILIGINIIPSVKILLTPDTTPATIERAK